MERASFDKIAVENSKTMCSYLIGVKHMTIKQVGDKIGYARSLVCKVRGDDSPEKVELAFFFGLIETCGIPYDLAMKKNLSVKDIIDWVSQG